MQERRENYVFIGPRRKCSYRPCSSIVFHARPSPFAPLVPPLKLPLFFSHLFCRTRSRFLSSCLPFSLFLLLLGSPTGGKRQSNLGGGWSPRNFSGDDKRLIRRIIFFQSKRGNLHCRYSVVVPISYKSSRTLSTDSYSVLLGE